MSIFFKTASCFEEIENLRLCTYFLMLKSNQVWLAICKISELFEHMTYCYAQTRFVKS